MRYDSEHKQRTYLKVLQEASIAIRKFGPDHLSISALMKRVGLTHGGFYAHFQSKEDLIDQALAYTFQDRFLALQSVIQSLEPAEALSSYLDFYLSHLHLQRREWGCPVLALASDVWRMPSTSQDVFNIGMTNTINAIADLLRQMQQPEPEQLARAIFSEMIGTMMVARSIPDPQQSEYHLEWSKNSIKSRLGLR